ncbi:prephenate dehydrogenase [Chloroflexota bacterium]
MKIAIIGGSGKMGQWFAHFLANEGQEVIITGRNQEKLKAAQRQLGVEADSNVAAAKRADAIIISVPIDNFEDVVKEISRYTRPGQIIVDLTSVKASPVATMHRHIKQAQVLGIHPVFGPGAKSAANQNIVLTPIGEDENTLACKIKGYLEKKGAIVTLMTPEEHDEMMAVILGLCHFIALVSADALLSFDNLKQLKNIGGTTYKVLLTMIESVLTEDPELYATLQMNLPRMAEVDKLFQDKTRLWAEMVTRKDRTEFTLKMQAMRDKFEQSDPDFGQAYENMYKLMDKQ